MSEALVHQFIEGLQHLERTGDPAPLLTTYADDSETSNVVTDRIYQGRQGAGEFWNRYRGAFGEVRSSFRNVIVADDHAALEWQTKGSDPDGDPIHYDGVSILELSGTGDTAKITRFRAFFDPIHLGLQMRPETAAATHD